MERKGALRTLAELAADQSGLVTAAQAVGAGVPRPSLSRLVANGRLEQVARGVYLVEGANAPDFLPIRAAWLRLDPARQAWKRNGLGPEDGVVSHRSATVVLDLGDIPADNVELSVPKRRTTREPGVRLLVRPDLTAGDVTMVGGLPVTTAERTIMDLLRDRADGAHVGTVIADADRRGLVDVDALAERVGGFATGYNMADASGRELVSMLVEQADRKLETDQVRDVADAAALLAYTAGAEDAWRRIGADLAVASAAGTALARLKHSPLSELATQWAERTAVSDAVLKAVADSPARELMDNVAQQTAMWESFRKHAMPSAVAQAVDASSVLHSLLGANPSTLSTLLETSRKLAEQMQGPARHVAAINAMLRAAVPPPETLALLAAIAATPDNEPTSDRAESAQPSPEDQSPDQHGCNAAYELRQVDTMRDAGMATRRNTAPQDVDP